jgi:hypothetical protein
MRIRTGTESFHHHLANDIAMLTGTVQDTP